MCQVYKLKEFLFSRVFLALIDLAPIWAIKEVWAKCINKSKPTKINIEHK